MSRAAAIRAFAVRSVAALVLAAAALPAAARCVPDRFPAGWLEEQEDAGGHTLERHVGKDDRFLLDRLARQPNIAAASTFDDRRTAERVIAAALSANRRRLDDWARRPGTAPGQTQAVRHTAEEPVGRIARRPAGPRNIEPGRRIV
ncbi:MAG TPA: RNase A-like domain-containing protein, partial [Alphaproteobacteria bacterium]|nr:RNase A-like domain-containing protein [Alphaproteobacteria bacterium]